MFVYLFAAVILLLSILFYKIRHYFNSDVYKNFGDDRVPVIKGGFSIAMMDPVELFSFVREVARKYQKSYILTIFFNTDYCITKAKDAEKILSSSKHLAKGEIYNLLDPFLKTGLLTSSGEKWFMRRRMLTPAFHFSILKEYFEIFKEESVRLVSDLKNTRGQEIDIINISTQFTLNAVCESAMGVKLSDLGNNGTVYRNNIYLIGKFIVDRVTKPWLYPEIVYSLFGYKKQLDDTLKPVHDFTRSIISKRKEKFANRKSEEMRNEKNDVDENENIYMRSKKKRYAMMDTLLQAQSEGLIDDEGIIEETDTFTFEGHDTTSSGMTFTLLLLAHHPEVQEKLFEEIQDVTSQRKYDDLRVDDFNKMHYMERVLKECLRIYPPVHFVTRTLSEDFDNDGIVYKKGSNVDIFIYDIHRDPEYFPDPEKFDPDRFLPEECEKRNNFSFLAFSAGMRNCIGQKFALLELKVMLTKVIQNFHIKPVTRREDLILMADIVLRSKNPIKMKFIVRK